jgi:hypothetical protein
MTSWVFDRAERVGRGLIRIIFKATRTGQFMSVTLTAADAQEMAQAIFDAAKL